MRFIKIFYIAFFAFVNSFVCDLRTMPEQPFEELKHAIESRDVQVITFTRPNGNEMPILPNDIIYLFEKINAITAPGKKLCVNYYDFAQKLIDIEQGNTKYDIDNYFKAVLGRIKDQNSEEITIDAIRKFLSTRSADVFGNIPTIDSNKWTVLVFQETFFSKAYALNNDIVKLIVECCNELTKNNHKLIIVVNFLHEFTRVDCPDWVRNYNLEKTDDLLGLIAVGVKPSMKFSISGERRLANYSLVICAGIPTNIYRKFFYATERNCLIEEGYVYESGDFLLKPVILDNPFASLFASNSFCRLFICADLNIADDKYKDIPFQPNNCLLSIVQSNTFAFSSSQFKVEPKLCSLFPVNKLIIHADAEFGPFVGFMRGTSIFAYKPKASIIKFNEGKIVKLDTDHHTYPLFSIFNKRVHTGVWGCSFGSVHCIMNVWGLSDKAELVELLNYSKPVEKGKCVIL